MGRKEKMQGLHTPSFPQTVGTKGEYTIKRK